MLLFLYFALLCKACLQLSNKELQALLRASNPSARHTNQHGIVRMKLRVLQALVGNITTGWMALLDARGLKGLHAAWT